MLILALLFIANARHVLFLRHKLCLLIMIHDNQGFSVLPACYSGSKRGKFARTPRLRQENHWFSCTSPLDIGITNNDVFRVSVNELVLGLYQPCGFQVTGCYQYYRLAL